MLLERNVGKMATLPIKGYIQKKCHWQEYWGA